MSFCSSDPADIPIIQGNNWPPAIWQFLVSEDPDVLWPLTGSIFKLTVHWPGGTPIIKSSNVNPELAIDLTTSMVKWTYTTAESRLLPRGRISAYELERWIDGTQQTVIKGHFAVSMGDNPD